MITHLRVRNQNLHDDVGRLGGAIQDNSTIKPLDCRDNNFNLTSLRYLENSLEENTNIVHMPFPEAERIEIEERCPRHILTSKPKNKGALDPVVEPQRFAVTSELKQTFDDVGSCLDRDKEAIEMATGYALDLDHSTETGNSRGWLSLELKSPEGITPMDVVHAMEQDQGRLTVKPSSLPPYHVRHDDDALDAPASVTSFSSAALPTPALESNQLESPVTGGDEAAKTVEIGPQLVKMLVEFELSGSELDC